MPKSALQSISESQEDPPSDVENATKKAKGVLLAKKLMESYNSSAAKDSADPGEGNQGVDPTGIESERSASPPPPPPPVWENDDIENGGDTSTNADDGSVSVVDSCVSQPGRIVVKKKIQQSQAPVRYDSDDMVSVDSSNFSLYIEGSTVASNNSNNPPPINSTSIPKGFSQHPGFPGGEPVSPRSLITLSPTALSPTTLSPRDEAEDSPTGRKTSPNLKRNRLSGLFSRQNDELEDAQMQGYNYNSHNVPPTDEENPKAPQVEKEKSLPEQPPKAEQTNNGGSDIWSNFLSELSKVEDEFFNPKLDKKSTAIGKDKKRNRRGTSGTSRSLRSQNADLLQWKNTSLNKRRIETNADITGPQVIPDIPSD